jgi:hypothetical protein
MEPISLIVGALGMGAAAAAKQVGGKVVQDAYDGLKRLIEDRYKRGGAIQALQEDPSSEMQKKALEESLTKAGADKDPDVVRSAGALTHALEALPKDSLAAVGIDLEGLKAISARFGDIDVSGHAKGVIVKNVEVDRLTVGNVKVQNNPN